LDGSAVSREASLSAGGLKLRRAVAGVSVKGPATKLMGGGGGSAVTNASGRKTLGRMKSQEGIGVWYGVKPGLALTDSTGGSKP